MKAALARHEPILNEAIASNHGYKLEHETPNAQIGRWRIASPLPTISISIAAHELSGHDFDFVGFAIATRDQQSELAPAGLVIR